MRDNERLKALDCRCGRPKVETSPLCRSCYDKLPRSTQHGLHTRPEDGYAEHFNWACLLLDDQDLNPESNPS